VLTKGKVGETYTIGGHGEKCNIDVVTKICDLLEQMQLKKPNGIQNFTQLIRFVVDRPGHDVHYAIDPSKITNELGWKPKEDFDSGMKKTIEWYLKNEAWWRAILDGSYHGERLGTIE